MRVISINEQTPHSRPDPQKCKETSNFMWSSLIWFVLVLFVCQNLFGTIVNLKIKCVTEPKMFLFCLAKILNQAFLHSPHICLWGFFTFLVDLAHGAPSKKRLATVRTVVRKLVVRQHWRKVAYQWCTCRMHSCLKFIKTVWLHF